MGLISLTLPADGQTAVVAPYNTALTSVAAVINGNIDATNIAPGSISTASVADSSITSAKIVDGTIVAADIANSTVTLAKLATGTTRLGIAKRSASTLLTTSFVTFLSVTATSTGKECEALFTVWLVNAGSGATRNCQVQVLCDGVLVDSILSPNAIYASAEYPPTPVPFLVSSTPAAGSHTWTLQALCAQNNAVTITNGYMKVNEVV